MPEAWTAARLERGLIEAFRASPALSVLTPRKGEMLAALDLDGAVTFDLIAACYHCLGQDVTARARESRLMLLTWARVMALSTLAARDFSLHELCRERHWAWRSFVRRRQGAAIQVAAMLEVASAACETANRLCDERHSGATMHPLAALAA
jgi:hypothetical protein